MKVICLDNHIGDTSPNSDFFGIPTSLTWPHLTVGNTYECTEQHPTRTDYIFVIGDGGVATYYYRKLFLDVTESRDKSLTKVLSE
jgi:hypothetical protein